MDSTASLDTLQDRQPVSLSRWVNEPYPAWQEILTDHDVARLTRRPPWLLCGMAFLRRFPEKRRFRGRKIGWLKSEVLDWMGRGSAQDVAASLPRLRTAKTQAVARNESSRGLPSPAIFRSGARSP